MRDIRLDLQERLDVVAKDKAALQAQIAVLEHVESGIKALLHRESASFVAPSSNGNGGSAGGTELSQFLSQALHEAGKPLTLDYLRDGAIKEGIDFGDKKPGRVVHWALVGMSQHGAVEKIENEWRIKD